MKRCIDRLGINAISLTGCFVIGSTGILWAIAYFWLPSFVSHHNELALSREGGSKSTRVVADSLGWVKCDRLLSPLASPTLTT